MRTGIRTFIAMIAVAFIFSTAQGAEGTLIGGTPYESWEKGGNDFFVMFNSLIDDLITLQGESDNRQPDTCINESSFTLNNFHTPDDAVVAKAYLVWMGAVDPAKFADPTDNAVFLNFTRYDSNYTHSEEIIAGDTAKLLGDTSNAFEFQSVQFNTDVTLGCSPTSGGTASTADVAYFTYRKDVTAFFEKIQGDNTNADNPLLDGDALYGTYTVSGLDCTDHDNYKCRTTMVSAWSLFFVYNSGQIRAKKIYLYPGFAWAQMETSVANVSGFVLPKNPILRLTTMIGEGDPSLVRPGPPELIYIRGQSAASTYQLTNDCNPYVPETMSYEIYNGVSSIYGWNQDENPEPLCVTGGYGEQKQGIDVDTFLLNSEDDVNLQEHLQLDNTSFDVTLSVNQDAILTNFLIVSVDTKSADFDIPKEASDWPEDREKHFCSCKRPEDQERSYCFIRPMYYLIKVQNWGTNVANNVTVIDNLDARVTYTPGTTEIATVFDEKGDGLDWQPIEDLAGNGSDPNTKFPLSGVGYKVADKMDTCNQATWTCKDTRLLRFRVVPKELEKNEVIPNEAIIKEAGSSSSYITNRSQTLKLYRGTCIPVDTCPEIKAVDCGGVCIPPYCGDSECNENKPCPEGYTCNLSNYTCEKDLTKYCSSAKVSYEKGINSPDSTGSTIIIPKGTTGLVIGQFKFMSENCAKNKFFDFVSLRLKIQRDDLNIVLKNLELVHDKNKNGAADTDEPVVAVKEVTDSTGVYLVLDPQRSLFAGNEDHYFIIRTDVDFAVAKVPGGASFRFIVESKDSFSFFDAGAAKPDGTAINFADFLVEPTENYFIVTKGANDPAVPDKSQINNDIPIMQLRTKALDAVNRIRRISVRIPSGDYVTFGKGIKSVSLYRDLGGDGILDPSIEEERVPIEKIAKFDDEYMVTFESENLENKLYYSEGQEIFIIVKAHLDLKGDDIAKLEIKRGDVLIQNTTKKVEGLPVSSKDFKMADIGTDDADTIDNKEDCKCSVVSNDGPPSAGLMLLLALAAMGLFLFRPRRRDDISL